MSYYSDYDALRVERSGGVLTITLNRPDHKNAFTAEMHTEFSRLFRDVRADDIGVIVLTGAGEHFSVAADLGWYSGVDREEWIRLMNEARWIVHDMLAVPQPIVVAMNGDAIGLGSSIVSLADFVVAVEGARVADHHTGMGLVCGDGGTMTYPFSMGLARAREFFMLGREFTSEELAEMGVFTRVVPKQDLEGSVEEIVNRLLEKPREALQWTKLAINRITQFSSFLSTDLALGFEGWSWHLPPSQEFTAKLREEQGGD